MNNKTQPLSQSAEPDLLTECDNDAERINEARLAADFIRLYRQYRRAGYEYYQQIQQAEPVLADEKAD